MELDNKQRLLVALYTEYQKDLPDMESIKPDLLGMPVDVFYVALSKLHSEGFITDVKTSHGGHSPIPVFIWWSNCKLTRYGLEYVEQKLSINPTDSGPEKVKNVIKKATEWGLDQLKDLGARTIAEMMKS